MLYICALVFSRCTTCCRCYLSLCQHFVCLILKSALNVVSFFLCFAFTQCFSHLTYMCTRRSEIKHHVDLFMSPPSLSLSSSACSNYKMLFCAGVPQRPCMKFIGPEFRHLTRKTWLTDLVPFPISSGSRVKLTFPASGLYLNPVHQRLMVPREILLSTLPFVWLNSGLLEIVVKRAVSFHSTMAPVTDLTINTFVGVTPGEASLWTAQRNSHEIRCSIYGALTCGKV